MPALLSGTAEYAAQTLRTKKVDELQTRGRRGLFSTPAEQALLRQQYAEGNVANVTTAAMVGDNSTLILSARGTFYLVKLSTLYGPGVYSIDELTREVKAPDFIGPTTDFRRPGDSTSPILLTSIEFNQVDITSQVPCLNNAKVFYSFGQNFGQVIIQGEILLGPLGEINYDGVNRIVDFFWRNRVSVRRKPIAVSVANNPYFVYLTGLRLGQVNPDFHIMPFAMFGTLLDIEREKATSINAAGKVITGGALNDPSLFSALQAPPNDITISSTSGSTSGVASPVGEVGDKISVGNDEPPDFEDVYAEFDAREAGPPGNEKAVEVSQLLSAQDPNATKYNLVAPPGIPGEVPVTQSNVNRVDQAWAPLETTTKSATPAPAAQTSSSNTRRSRVRGRR